MNIKIDLKDKRILFELDKDSRQSNKKIAKNVGLSEQVTGNRIKRLFDNNILDYSFIKINHSLLGYLHIRIYLRLHNITEEKQKVLLNNLNKKKGVFWLASLRGKYDLTLSMYIKHISEFSKKYDYLFGDWGDYILDRNIIFLEKAYTYTKAYLIPNKEPQEIIYSEEKRNVELDEIDIALFKVLNKEGRKPLVDIAREIGTSSDTIRYHIKNLKKKGIITGFGIKINFEKLCNKYYLISLKLQNMTKEKYKTFETLAKINKNIIIFIKTLGNHDIELEVETTNNHELDNIIKTLRDTFTTEIKDYDLLEVTKEYHINYYPF